MEKNYKTPPIVWLKVTGYMHAWLQKKLGGEAVVQGQRVVCFQHLPGATIAMKKETFDDTQANLPVMEAISAKRKLAVDAGFGIDPEGTRQLYGLTEDTFRLFIPVECPDLRMTSSGLMRPWKVTTCMGRDQARTVQEMLRQAFWKAVEDHNAKYAVRQEGRKYAAVDMLEDFCKATGTPDLHVAEMRREWQRRVKRGENRAVIPARRWEYASLLNIV